MKLSRIINECPVFLLKLKFFQHQPKTPQELFVNDSLWKQLVASNFSHTILYFLFLTILVTLMPFKQKVVYYTLVINMVYMTCLTTFERLRTLRYLEKSGKSQNLLEL